MYIQHTSYSHANSHMYCIGRCTNLFETHGPDLQRLNIHGLSPNPGTFLVREVAAYTSFGSTVSRNELFAQERKMGVRDEGGLTWVDSCLFCRKACQTCPVNFGDFGMNS